MTNYSLYLIGSKARGDDNVNSDLDYVCVYDQVKPPLKLDDASISFYSLPRMRWMVEKSKLFVLHLILEGKAITEQISHRQLLNSFRLDEATLQKDYIEFTENIKCLKWIPKGSLGVRWACDYIYTITRNIVYIENALNGYFRFGYQDAVSHFLKKKAKESLLPIFIELRAEKYKYRNGDQSEPAISLSKLEQIGSALTGLDIHLALGGVSNLGHPKLTSYEVLRLIERAIINKEISDDNYLHQLKNHGEYFFALRQTAQDLLDKLNATEVRKV